VVDAERAKERDWTARVEGLRKKIHSLGVAH
jgi:hypothetical protein